MNHNFEFEAKLMQGFLTHIDRIDLIKNDLQIHFFRGYPEEIHSQGNLLVCDIFDFVKTKDEPLEEDSEETFQLYQILGFSYELKNFEYTYCL